MIKRLLASLTAILTPRPASLHADPARIRELLAAGNRLHFKAANTGSMRPILRGGETIAIENRPFESLTLGARVAGVTTNPGVIVIHEIVSGDPINGFVTKGRANHRPDPFRLTRERYLGAWHIVT